MDGDSKDQALIGPIPVGPSAGAIGGAAGEAGSIFRADVATWFIAHGLRGFAVSGLGLAESDAVPSAVSLETDDAVDDIRVDFDMGGHAQIQVKHSVISLSRNPGSEFAGVVEQWKRAVTQKSLRRGRDRLVLVVPKLNSSLSALVSALERRRAKLSGAMTSDECDAVNKLDAHLDGLTGAESELLVDSVAILGLDVGNEGTVPRTAGELLLDGQVVAFGQGRRAWEELTKKVHKRAARRLGWTIPEWIAVLRNAKFDLVVDREGSRSARLEASRQALQRYRDSLIRRGTRIDPIAIGNVRPIDVPEVGLHLRGCSEHRGNKDVPLLILLRRAGRVLLTGLPGAGKSVAIDQIAARYASRDDGPLPLVVRLTMLLSQPYQANPLEALLSLALAIVPAGDRLLVEQDVRRSIAAGRVVWLLDGLDECREQRESVTGSLRVAFEGLHEDVEVVLSTRDSAYASARTLGFEEIHLRLPEDLGSALSACARNIAESRGVVDIEAWCQERLHWVEELRSQDSMLRETPLLSMLLVILACENDRGALPKRRAKVLAEVVDLLARRWEHQRRRGGQSLGHMLEGEAVPRVLLQGFAEIAHWLHRGGEIPVEDIERSLSDMLIREWGMSSGLAGSRAAEIRAFWDEAGIFVARGVNGLVGARIRLFAELGEARRVARLGYDSQVAWVEERWVSSDREVLVLAAGLSPSIANILIKSASGREAVDDVLLAARAVEEGATPDTASLGVLVDRMLEELGLPLFKSWQIAASLVRMPLPPEMHGRVLDACWHSLPGERALVVKVLGLALWPKAAEWHEPIASWKELIRIPPLKVLRDGVPRSTREWLLADATDKVYGEALQIAAQGLLSRGIEHGPLVKLASQKVSPFITAMLAELFGKAGRPEAATLLDQITQAARDLADAWPRISRFYPGVLEMVAGFSVATASYKQQRRLDCVVSFFDAVMSDQVSLRDVVDTYWELPGELFGFLKTLATLSGFDLGVLAGEAAALLAEQDLRVEQVMSTKGLNRRFDDWARVENSDEVRRMLIGWMSKSDWFAVVGAEALAESPSPEVTALELINALPSMSRWRRDVAARTVLTLEDVSLSRVRQWLASADSALRSVAGYALAALWVENSSQVSISEIRAALLDVDAGVRASIIKGLGDAAKRTETSALFAAMEEYPPTHWDCYMCDQRNSDCHTRTCEQCGYVGRD